jgi:hypothetical protein
MIVVVKLNGASPLLNISCATAGDQKIYMRLLRRQTVKKLLLSKFVISKSVF